MNSLKFCEATDKDIAAIECPDGRCLVLDCHEGPADDEFLRTIVRRYNDYTALEQQFADLERQFNEYVA